MDEDQSLLWLTLCSGLSASRRRALLRSQGSAQASRLFLQAQGHQGPHFDVMEKALRSQWMTARHPHYPASLLQLSEPPEVLYYLGRPELWSSVKTAVTIVGTRRPSSTGGQLAGRFAHCLAQVGVSIVSGFARGIDSAAHWASLDHAHSPPLAVLACGLDYAYPSENMRLYRQVAEQGLLLSEYPPDHPPLAHHFQDRNRLLAALSAAVLVVEAPARSGVLITVEHALKLGREVFVVPGPIDHPNYQGSLRLIQEGAALVTTPRDLLEQLPGYGLQRGDCGQGPARAEVWAERWGMDLSSTLVLLTGRMRSGEMHKDPHGCFGWGALVKGKSSDLKGKRSIS